MNIYKFIMIIFCMEILSGCGTFLSVGEKKITEIDSSLNGVAVNKRVIYNKMKVNDTELPTLARGIDNNILLIIGGQRMMFSSGHLEITLTQEQLTSQVKITSETGAERAAQAAGAIYDATKKPEKPDEK